MARSSFAQVSAALASLDISAGFRCIANPYNTGYCQNDVHPDQASAAKEILDRADVGQSLKDLRDVISCILCGEHQRTYRHKDKVEARWSAEFPHLDFSTRRNRSPYSLSPNSKRARQLSQDTSSDHCVSSSENTAAPRVRRASPRPDAQAQASTQQIWNDRSFIATPLDVESEQPNSSPSDSDGDEFDTCDEGLWDRGRLRATRSPHDSAVTCSEQATSNAQEASAQHEAGNVEAIEGDAADGVLEISHSFEVADETTPSISSRFHLRKEAAWAPSKIRCHALDTLLLPMSQPRPQGSIYVVRVKDTGFVKIGITAVKVDHRLSSIPNEHDLDLDLEGAWWLSEFSGSFRTRLEKVVHADLAHCRRDIRVRTKRSNRTHSEYFEIDFATAIKRIEMWRDIMLNLELDSLEPGHSLDRALCNEIRANPALSVETFSTRQPAATDEAEYWSILNHDHQRTQSIWEEVFRSIDRSDKANGVSIVSPPVAYLPTSQHVQDVHASWTIVAISMLSFMLMQQSCLVWSVHGRGSIAGPNALNVQLTVMNHDHGSMAAVNVVDVVSW